MIARNQFSLAACLLTVVTVTVPGCGTSALGKVAPPAPEVTVSKPVVREVTDYFEFPGQTEAVGEVEIRARVTGYIVKVNFEDGQEVKKGDLLFEIDPRPYQAALGPGDGRPGAPARHCLAKAKSDLARSERLRPSGAVSEDEYEQHVAQLKVAQASIQSAEAAVRDAELNLEFTRVVSPIDGRVSRRRITEGNLVQPGANESTVLTTVVTIDPIYVYFNIDEQALLKYQESRLAIGPGRAAARGSRSSRFRSRSAWPTKKASRTRGPRFRRQQGRSRDGHDPRPRRVRQRASGT